MNGLGLNTHAKSLIAQASRESQRTPQVWIRDAILDAVAQFNVRGVHPTMMLEDSPYAQQNGSEWRACLNQYRLEREAEGA